MRYLSSAIAFILIVVVLFFGVTLIRNQLSSNKTAVVNVVKLPLSDYKKSGTKLRFIISGPTVAEENKRELVYEISQSGRRVKLLKGYNGTLVKEEVLANNYSAYDEFADALFMSGFTKARSGVSDSKYTGDCPSGNLYTTELISAEGDVQSSLWQSSCTTKKGTLNASYSTILKLFKDQFPNYKSFSTDISID